MKKILPDHKWNSIYWEKPREGQKCASKISGEDGYASSCIYQDGYFQSWSDERNRIVITRWKHDLWLPEGKEVEEI